MKKLIFGCLFFLACQWAMAQQSEFTVTLSADTIGLNNRLEVTFTLKNAQGKNFEAPVFEGFRLLGGPNTSSQFSMVNGEVTRQISYTYVLQPSEPGLWYIQPASIAVEGKTLETTLKEVWVLADRESPPPSRSPAPEPKKNRPITKM